MIAMIIAGMHDQNVAFAHGLNYSLLHVEYTRESMALLVVLESPTTM